MIYIIEECSLERLAFKLERNPIQKAFNGFMNPVLYFSESKLT